MAGIFKDTVTRREFLKSASVSAAGIMIAPYLSLGQSGLLQPEMRLLGKTGFEVTTLGLGGQASLQWTSGDINPRDIILKAFHLGVNYFDTSNIYDGSQLNYGRAFRELHLIPGASGYDERLRRTIFLASKTAVRYAKASSGQLKGATQGASGSTAVDDVKRSLSQMFGDGKGDYPEGAYLDVVQIHSLSRMEQVEQIFEGLDSPSPRMERIGALAGLRDLRDGTNLTGLNPREERLIRHIGLTGHFSSPVMMYAIQRDRFGIFDTLLVAINANDRKHFNHQYNVIPVAAAKGMGVIGMKVFSDGAMYTKGNHWSRGKEDVVYTVGSKELPSSRLVQYTLSTPGVHTCIIGIGKIASDDRQCQLTQNLQAAQTSDELDGGDRRQVEEMVAERKGTQTNYFQDSFAPLGAPRNGAARRFQSSGKGLVEVDWDTSYAGPEPISHYEILRNGERIGRVEHKPQITAAPFRFVDQTPLERGAGYAVRAFDRAGGSATSPDIAVK